MIVDWIVRLIDKHIEAEQAKAAKKDEVPPVVPSLAESPPRPRSQPLKRTVRPLPEKPEGLSMKAERFLADVIEPHQDGFHSLDLLEIVYDLVLILDEHGFCPSVVQTLKRHDADAALNGKLLSLVSLDEHSYRVARMMVDLFRENKRGRDCEIMTPGLVIAGLAHDLGKIPAFRERHVERYAMADHPIISAAVIEEIFASKRREMLPGLREAILNHHRGENQENYLLEYLRKGDARAREEEVRIHSERAWQSWEKWFVPKEYLSFLEPEINIMRGSTCQIFSFKSVVYATPDFLYNKAIAYAKSKNVVDPAFVSSRNKPLALKRIVGTIRDHGMLSGNLPSDYYGMLHQIATKKFFFKLFLTPLKIEAFDVFPSTFEERKVGWLKMIVSVSPCTPKK
jgi:hypothetical protein